MAAIEGENALPPGQAAFRGLLLTVAGQAFSAADYHLDDKPMQWAGGKFRFSKRWPDGVTGIVFQHLLYHDTEHASGMPSRFRVMLHPRHGPARDLSALVVEDFGVAILPSAAHWWPYQDTSALAKALAEAGHLVIGYGLGWLSGELTPPAG